METTNKPNRVTVMGGVWDGLIVEVPRGMSPPEHIYLHSSPSFVSNEDGRLVFQSQDDRYSSYTLEMEECGTWYQRDQ